MLIIPNHSDVPHVAIEALKEPGSEEQPLFQPGACLLETQRGRELTEEPVQLVDLTWTYVGHFTLPHFGQHAVPRDQVLGFMPGDSTCRPRLAEAQGLAADWLVSMDAITGEEFMDEGEDVDPPPAPEPEPQLSWIKNPVILSYVFGDPWSIIRCTAAPNSGFQLFWG